jgi:hypothetical protein
MQLANVRSNTVDRKRNVVLLGLILISIIEQREVYWRRSVKGFKKKHLARYAGGEPGLFNSKKFQDN